MLSARVLVALLVLAELHAAGAVRRNQGSGRDVGHDADKNVGQESLALAGIGGGGGNGTVLAGGDAGGDAGGEPCGYNPEQPRVGLVDPEKGQVFRFELDSWPRPVAALLVERLTPQPNGPSTRQVFNLISQRRVLALSRRTGPFSAFEVGVADVAGAPSVWKVYKSGKFSGIWTRESWRVADCEGNVVFTVNQQHGRGGEVWKVYLGLKRDEHHLFWASLSSGSTNSYYENFEFTFYTDPKSTSEEHKIAKFRNNLGYRVVVFRPEEDAGIILIASALIAASLADKWNT